MQRSNKKVKPTIVGVSVMRSRCIAGKVVV